MSATLSAVASLLILAGIALGGIAPGRVAPATPSATECAAPVQPLLDAAPPGSVVVLPPCVARETLIVNRPLTIRGEPRAEIRGSDIWTGWTPRDGSWVSTLTVPPFASHGECRPDRPLCAQPEQVFLDGAPLTRAADRPAAGAFALDEARHVVLGEDPAGHLIEVSTRTRWLIPEVDGVVVDGLTMRHAANDAQTGALQDDGRAMTVIGCVLSDAHGAVAWLTGNSELLDSDLSRGGQLGLGVGGRRVAGNRIHHNNTAGFDPGWEAGGFKAVSHDVVVERNEIDHNEGPGIWFDIRSERVTIRDNRVFENRRTGIFVEVSSDVVVRDNVVWRNGLENPGWLGGAGILVHSSTRVEVVGNLVAWNGDGIGVVSQERPDRPDGADTAIRVADNVVVMQDGPDTRLALGWADDWASPLFATDSRNVGSGNRFWYPSDEAGWPRFAWNGPISRVAVFATTPGGTGARYTSRAEASELLRAAGIPVAPPEPAVRAAFTQEGVLETTGLLVVAIVVAAGWAARRTEPRLGRWLRALWLAAGVGYAAMLVGVRTMDFVPDGGESVAVAAVIGGEVAVLVAVFAVGWWGGRRRLGAPVAG